MTSGSRCRWLPCIAVGVLIAFAAGCGSTSSTTNASATKTAQGTSTAAQSPTAAPVLTPSAAQLVLAVSDLPSGWVVDNSPPTTGSASCYYNPLQKVPTTSYAEGHFVYSGNRPVIVQQVGTYGAVAQAFKEITAILDKCTTFTETTSGKGQAPTTATGTMGQMSFPTFGTESAAYSVTEVVEGVNVVQNFVIARVGNALDEVALGDIGSVNNAQLANLERIAVAKAKSVQARL
jgi:hypothetical protein